MSGLLLLGSLLLILVTAEAFVNALEHLGEQLGVSQGVTGALFAAVATALPETVIPLLALASPDHGLHAGNTEIGTGAILGAPLMLSTLSVSLLAFATAHRRGWQGNFAPEPTGLRRDLNAFLLLYSLACLTMLLPAEQNTLRSGCAFLLVLGYFLYVLSMLRDSARLKAAGHGTEASARLWLTRIGLPERQPVIVMQLAAAIALLLVAANGFIDAVRAMAPALGISPLLLSLLIVPVATELPEKINSLTWIRRRQDTLAFGNITGAMVFQGSLLPAIGMMLTSWQPQPALGAGIFATLAGALWLRLCLARGTLRLWQVGANLLLYVLFLALSLTR